jgi:hypothetical protein
LDRSGEPVVPCVVAEPVDQLGVPHRRRHLRPHGLQQLEVVVGEGPHVADALGHDQ